MLFKQKPSDVVSPSHLGRWIKFRASSIQNELIQIVSAPQTGRHFLAFRFGAELRKPRGEEISVREEDDESQGVCCGGRRLHLEGRDDDGVKGRGVGIF